MSQTAQTSRAPEPAEREHKDAARQFCTFWIAGRLYGVDILDVKEINDEKVFTTIHHAPPEIRGYVNIRGVIHLVLDLGMLLGLDRDEAQEKRLVIFKQSVAPSFGVLVDRVGDVVNVPESQVETRLAGEEHGEHEDYKARVKRLMAGVCKLKEDLLVLLNARKFLGSLRIGSPARIA